MRLMVTFALVCVTLASSGASIAQSSGNGGAKFVTNNERSLFKSTERHGPCTFYGQNLSVCYKDTPWVLETQTLDGDVKQALFKWDERRRAAVRVLVMDRRASRALSAQEVTTLIKTNVFDASPRGERTREAVLSQHSTPTGVPSREVSIVRGADGQRVVLRLTVFRLDEGLGFVETTRDLEDSDTPDAVPEEDLAFHEGLLNIMKTNFKWDGPWK
ncbi:MAG: hypothetical protein ABJH45_24265 [Paracoccaceae bacterium]